MSPFNDRSGFYTCSIVPPLHHPTGVKPESYFPEALPGLEPSIRIDLHTSDPRTKSTPANNDGREAPTKKLLAVLRPTHRRPFTFNHLLRVLAKYPFSLFLSFPLIAYEAARLHYLKGLYVYGRPAPRAAELSVESRLATPSNPVQQEEKNARIHGDGVGWQPEGVLERYSRRLVEEFLRVRARELEIQVKLVFSDPSFGTRAFPCDAPTSEKNNTILTIFVRSPQAFVFLFISPSLRHALALGRDSEHQFSVSSEQVFIRVFDVRPLSIGTSLGRLAQRIRLLAVPRRLLLDSTRIPRVHFLDLPYASNKIVGIGREVTNILVLFSFYFLLYLEKYIFAVLHARFVPGDEPWNIWKRVEDNWYRSVNN